MIEVKVCENEKNQRLDKFLLKYLNNANKSFIYKMLRKKRIKLNLKKANGNEILNLDDIIQLYLSEETISSFQKQVSLEKTSQNFSIIYEDKNLIISSKPTNLVSQPDASNKSNSLNDQLLYYLYKKGEYSPNNTFKPSICNRLDRNTSGIVVFGKTFEAVQLLNKAFKEREIDKYYLTVVNGVIKEKGILKMYYLAKENNQVIISKNYIKNSKEILTEYKPLKTKNNLTLLEVKLITGKTHQVRVSFNHFNHPIIGDRKYGNENLNKKVKEMFGLENQFLHCYKIVFKQKNSSLEYLYNKQFISKEFSPTFKKVMDYFDY